MTELPTQMVELKIDINTPSIKSLLARCVEAERARARRWKFAAKRRSGMIAEIEKRAKYSSRVEMISDVRSAEREACARAVCWRCANGVVVRRSLDINGQGPQWRHDMEFCLAAAIRERAHRQAREGEAPHDA